MPPDQLEQFRRSLAQARGTVRLAAGKIPLIRTARMRAADAQILAMRVPSTPCVVVNGRYRIDMTTLHSQDDSSAWSDTGWSKENRHL